MKRGMPARRSGAGILCVWQADGTQQAHVFRLLRHILPYEARPNAVFFI